MIPNKTHNYETLGKHAGGGKRYVPPMIEISPIIVECAFAMSKDNVEAGALHQGYFIEDEFNW